jgi:uncharacterized Fe-S cluster-containing MiaB family protein
MYSTYVESSSAKRKENFQCKFQAVTVPHRETIDRTVIKLRQAGSLLDEIKLKHQVVTKKKLNKISARIIHTPQKFFTFLEEETKVSKSSVRTAQNS